MTYDRITCHTKTAQDVEDAAAALAASEADRERVAATVNVFEEVVMALSGGDGAAQYGVKHCRRCELSCPVRR